MKLANKQYIINVEFGWAFTSSEINKQTGIYYTPIDGSKTCSKNINLPYVYLIFTKNV